jgi:uncharacterized membrane protein YoaK (UPF0700 family)
MRSCGTGRAAALRLGIIVAFFCGVVAHRMLARRIKSENISWNPAVVSLGIECCLLCSLALLNLQGHLQTILLLLAWAMGLQNDAFQQIGPVNLNTTFLTGDIEKLGSTLATSVSGAERRKQRRTRMAAFLTAWIAYVAGAILGAIGNHFFELKAFLIPAAMTVLVIILELTGRA